MATATGTTRTAPAHRTGALRLPRTTGAVSGLLIILLGVWGGLIPFVGPYFHYAFGGYQTWHYTSQRLWLEIVPGAVAVIGGLMLMRATTRVGGLTAGWVALAAGAWFAVGPVVSLLWHHTIYAIGVPAGGYTRQMLEWVGYFFGLGALIIALAAFAMGRFVSRPRLVEEGAIVAEDAAADAHGRRGHTAVAAAPAAAAVADRRGERAAVADTAAERHGAVADAPAERGAVADTSAERGPVADVPGERGAVADTPAERGGARDLPAEPGGVPTVPAERAAVADAPAERAPVTDAPPADAPATTTSAPTTTDETTTGAPVATQRRRTGGLLGRFRR